MPHVEIIVDSWAVEWAVQNGQRGRPRHERSKGMSLEAARAELHRLVAHAGQRARMVNLRTGQIGGWCTPASGTADCDVVSG